MLYFFNNYNYYISVLYFETYYYYLSFIVNSEESISLYKETYFLTVHIVQ